jgi:hypothetical protein
VATSMAHCSRIKMVCTKAIINSVIQNRPAVKISVGLVKQKIYLIKINDKFIMTNKTIKYRLDY